MSITIACDIDGVIAPLEPSLVAADTVELPHVCYGTHVLVSAIHALKNWSSKGATILWHTTWDHVETDELERLATLPHLDRFSTDEKFAAMTPMWWKAASVQRWLDDAGLDDRLVWIDDDIIDEFDGIPVQVRSDRRLIMISPSPEIGLSKGEITHITDLIKHHARN